MKKNKYNPSIRYCIPSFGEHNVSFVCKEYGYLKFRSFWGNNFLLSESEADRLVEVFTIEG